jgi:hypothetical protein
MRFPSRGVMDLRPRPQDLHIDWPKVVRKPFPRQTNGYESYTQMKPRRGNTVLTQESSE